MSITNHGIPTPLIFVALDAARRRMDDLSIMPDSITDGEQFEDAPLEIYEERDGNDSLNDTLREIARLQIPGEMK